MKNVSIDFQNCFGIGSLSHTFNFEQSNTYLIYAPNGTMKTSFANTMRLISLDDPSNRPSDRVYTDVESVYRIVADSNDLENSRILVIDAESEQIGGDKSISSFLAKEELKKQYDDIYSILNKEKIEFIKELKSISNSTDCEEELEKTFFTDEITNFFEILLYIQRKLNDTSYKPNFKYNDVFDKGGKVKGFLEKHKNELNQYITSYNDLLSKSNFFKGSSDNSFGTFQANSILKAIDDNSFFDAGHRFTLHNQQEITTKDELKTLIEEEVKKISEDEALKKIFDRIDKAIMSNADLRKFHAVIGRDSTLLLRLSDYEGFKKDVWVGFLSNIKNHVDRLVKLYRDKQKNLAHIINEAQKDIQLWNETINTFNTRFKVPFTVSLSNQVDIILKQETATLDFHYKNRNNHLIAQDKNSLLKILSRGELRAFHILQFLFELESRKKTAQTQLLILDDIADSFDYKNKFAIIEYIQELHEKKFFKIIALTHNFDFYRTIASRLSLSRRAVYMATSDNNKAITLHAGEYRKDVFLHFLERVNDKKVFISLIAFVRNLIEYSKGQSSVEYSTLTDCLHFKKNTCTLKVKDVFSIYTTNLQTISATTIDFGDDLIIDIIYETAKIICSEEVVNEINLENKIALAIAIRLKAEEYMISKLEHTINTDDITNNQTHRLYSFYKSNYPTSLSLETLDKVNLMTPENIHINAFMYEPLIDMSISHLIDLFNEIKDLD